MAKGKIYTSERAILRDARSGLRLIRLTHYSTISMNLYFEMCAFTEDDQYVVFLAQRGAGRDAPWDLFRARTDGLELVQMTDCDDIGGIVVSPAKGCAYYQTGRELRKVDIVSLKESAWGETPADPAGEQPLLASIDAKGKQYFAGCVNAMGAGWLYRADTASGEVDVLFEGERQGHIHADPKGKSVFFIEYREAGSIAYLIDGDGKRLRPYPFKQFAHHTWFGKSGKMQGCLLPPGHAIVTYAEGDAEPKVLAQGRYYWHSSPSADWQWIVADTNWPQEGIYLVHVPTGAVTFVCDPRSTCSHPQWTHPHPSISPKGRFVLFNSDRTGMGQVYLAELTEEFMAKAAKGYVCTPNVAG